MSAPNLATEYRFADYFVICGLDFESGLEPDRLFGDNLHVSPLDRSYKAIVLAHYPENVHSNKFDEHAVCMLCLPAGLQFKTQKHSLEPKFHSFVVTRENGSRYYGFSLIFYEEVRNRNICSAMHTLQAMYITELSSGQTPPNYRKSGKESSRSLPRSFKITPHTGSALTYYDITKDKLYVAKSIALICQFPFVRAAQMFLENLFRSLPRQPGPGLSPESYVYNLLYQVPVPSPGQGIRVYLPPPEPHLQPTPVVINMPNLPEELPLFDYPLRVMFATLGVDCVVQLFTCVLLEHQVLLRSSDYNKLMLVAECITALLVPFTWAHVYVPILPAPLYHFLDAPVPFVMGLHTDSASSSAANGRIAVGSEAALCLVDIDKPDIQLPEELPVLPHRTAFVEELNHILDRHQIQRPETEPTRLGGASVNGLSYKYVNDSMTSSCTLPSGMLRRKHSANDILDCNESLPLTRSPPPSPRHRHVLHRIQDIVARTGVNMDDVDSETVMPAQKKIILNDEDQYEDDLKLNAAIRETFLNRFVHMLLVYENFVIVPDQDRDSWLSSRDSMVNFDKASFLSDQPQRHRPFLSRFLETQMFASLIDNKILASWGDFDANLQVFEMRVKAAKRRHTDSNRGYTISPRPPLPPPPPSLESPVPKERLPHRAAYYRAFPAKLDAAVLVPPKEDDHRTNSLKRIKNAKWQVKEQPELKLEHSHRLSTESTPAAIAQNNRTFVEKLLKECKSKTKRMLVEKMGTEDTGLALGTEVSLTGVEESTMIASLCDLLERLWSHGLQHKMGKSALWMHLLNYQELEQCTNSKEPIDPNYLSPDLSSVGAEVESRQARSSSSTRSRDSSRGGSRDSSRDRLSNSSTLERKAAVPPNPLRPLPQSLTFDMRNVQAMTDIKTEIGYARAWVRLSLEKKLLSKHLRELLADTTLLRSQYKRTAFLRCEEEREQFLYHLLTLNAVDYFCFTNTYLTTKLPYRVLIVPSRKASQTTANCWIAISGANGDSTPKIPMPKNTNEFVFHHKNLGILSTLRIGHDNSGLSPRWLLDHIYVRNEVTGHTYLFPCSRWLGSGVDDGSTERLLVARLQRPAAAAAAPPAAGSVPPQTPTTTHLSTSTIQHMIGDCVNAIVKWHYQSKRDKDAASLSVLLCGDNGLVKCLEQAFLCGFKSARLFGKNLFIWDYFERVKDEFKQSLTEDQSPQNTACAPYNCRQEQEHRAIWRCYCHLVDEISQAGRSLGKDGKFQLFICLSLREHWLHRMLQPMSNTRVTAEMYEEQSFLRKRGLLTFLKQILEPLDEFDIVLEHSLTQGI